MSMTQWLQFQEIEKRFSTTQRKFNIHLKIKSVQVFIS